MPVFSAMFFSFLLSVLQEKHTHKLYTYCPVRGSLRPVSISHFTHLLGLLLSMHNLVISFVSRGGGVDYKKLLSYRYSLLVYYKMGFPLHFSIVSL